MWVNIEDTYGNYLSQTEDPDEPDPVIDPAIPEKPPEPVDPYPVIDPPLDPEPGPFPSPPEPIPQFPPDIKYRTE